VEGRQTKANITRWEALKYGPIALAALTAFWTAALLAIEMRRPSIRKKRNEAFGIFCDVLFASDGIVVRPIVRIVHPSDFLGEGVAFGPSFGPELAYRRSSDASLVLVPAWCSTC
jgi:hypothetical protein